MGDTVSIFISYADEDNLLREELQKHFSTLERQGKITIWHKHSIKLGTNLQQEIEEHLNHANIIFLLISPDYMASKDCQSEMDLALVTYRKRMEELNNTIYIIPIILRHVDWKNAPFAMLKVLPQSKKPIASINSIEQDKTFKEVFKAISKKVEDILDEKKLASASPNTDTPTPIPSELLQRERQEQAPTTTPRQASNNLPLNNQPRQVPILRRILSTRRRLIPAIITSIIIIILLSSLLLRFLQISTISANISHNNTQTPKQASLPIVTPSQTLEQASSPTPNTILTTPNSSKMLYQADWSKGTLDGWETNDSSWHVVNNTYLTNSSTSSSDITAPLSSLPKNYDIYAEIRLVDAVEANNFYSNARSFGIFVGSSSKQSANGYTCSFQANYIGPYSVHTSLIPPGSTPIATSILQRLTEFTITLRVRGDKIEAFVGTTGQICKGEMHNLGKYIGITTQQAAIGVDAFKVIESN